MQFLIDAFSPAELLHIVSIANKYQLLDTEQKRFLIALRMSNAHDGQSYQIEAGKKNKFYRIFGQFLQEIQEGQDCGKDDCAVCRRLAELRDDFHGAQQSVEFRLFIEWFQDSTREYGAPDEAPAPRPAPRPEPIRAEPIRTEAVRAEPVRPEALSVAGDPLALADTFSPACSIPAHERAIDRLADTHGAPAGREAIFPQFAEFASDEPLFCLNESHPLVRQLGALLGAEVDSLGEAALRSYAHALRGLSGRLLAQLAGSGRDQGAENNPPRVTAG